MALKSPSDTVIDAGVDDRRTRGWAGGTNSFLCLEHQLILETDYGKCSAVGPPRSQRGIGGERCGKTKKMKGGTGMERSENYEFSFQCVCKI